MILGWLQDEGYTVHAVYVDLGQPCEDREAILKKARDCGAHFVMTKPLTPITVLERVLWIAREGRRFVESDTYMGPDRRFKNEGVPAGQVGRRRDDLVGDVGEASTPNMEQDSIDGMLKTRRVNL